MSVRYPLMIILLFLTFAPPLNANQIANLAFPQHMIADEDATYFIANANGDPGNRENQGFITKVNKEGEVTNLHFIQGGVNSVTLHSPNGMAIVGETLYVADLDTIRGFHKRTGEPMATIPFTQHHCQSLTGLASDIEGTLFVSDTDTNSIYRVDPSKDYTISLLIRDESLSHPHDIAIHPRSGHLMGVGWDDGKIFEIDENGIIHELFVNSFFSGGFYNLDGIDFDQYGTMYVSDMTAGKVWRIRNNQKKEVIAEFLVSPSGLAIDRANHLILVPYLYANGAEINGLERPSNTNIKKKPRSWSDYGMNWFKKDEPQ
ncbi:MAG: hypothetical protein AB7P17_00975 [Nitrospirales bacterium]|nr:hypothetical protein [Nitrospirales bacterium]